MNVILDGKTPGVQNILVSRDNVVLGMICQLDTGAKTMERVRPVPGGPPERYSESLEGCEFMLLPSRATLTLEDLEKRFS